MRRTSLCAFEDERRLISALNDLVVAVAKLGGGGGFGG